MTFSEAVTNQMGLMPSIIIQTNLDIAARLQVPKGKGVILVDSPPLEWKAAGRFVAVFIEPL